METTLKRISGYWNSYPNDQAHHEILSDSRWGSFDCLTNDPRLNRGWVVQEAGLRKDVQILRDTEFLSWTSIMRTYFWLSARAPSSRSQIQRRIPGLHLHVYDRRHLLETKVFRLRLSREMGENVLNLLCSARRLELSDRRNRIYAFIGLPGFQNLLQDLVIDYHKPWPEVYYDIAC